jgi:hypothetical protein
LTLSDKIFVSSWAFKVNEQRTTNYKKKNLGKSIYKCEKPDEKLYKLKINQPNSTSFIDYTQWRKEQQAKCAMHPQ